MSEELIISEQDPGTIIDNNSSNKSMEIIHVISIDFNYIMYPCIKLYQDLSNEKENAMLTWDLITNYRGVSREFLQYDTRSYTKITKLIQTIMYDTNNRCKLIPIKDHSNICDQFINQEGITLDLVNIDFYHDIFYTKDDKNRIINFGTYDSKDWVGNLFLYNKIDSYVWIKAPNSNSFNFGLLEGTNIKFNYEDGIKTLDYFDILTDCSDIWDYIFVNFPEHQVPFEYKHLYDLIFELFQRKE